MPKHTEVEQTRLTQIGFSSAGGRACMCYQRRLVSAGLATHVNFKQSSAVFGRYVRHSVPRSGRIHNTDRVFTQWSCPFIEWSWRERRRIEWRVARRRCENVCPLWLCLCQLYSAYISYDMNFKILFIVSVLYTCSIVFSWLARYRLWFFRQTAKYSTHFLWAELFCWWMWDWDFCGLLGWSNRECFPNITIVHTIKRGYNVRPLHQRPPVLLACNIHRSSCKMQICTVWQLVTCATRSCLFPLPLPNPQIRKPSGHRP